MPLNPLDICVVFFCPNCVTLESFLEEKKYKFFDFFNFFKMSESNVKVLNNFSPISD